jgi:hypothetical protein
MPPCPHRREDGAPAHRGSLRDRINGRRGVPALHEELGSGGHDRSSGQSRLLLAHRRLSMQALPSVLDPVEPLARVVYQSGWRPTPAAGPNRRELAEIVDAVAA